MTLVNLIKKGKDRIRKRGGISLLEILTYGAAGLYYLIYTVFIITGIIAGWKYILS